MWINLGIFLQGRQTYILYRSFPQGIDVAIFLHRRETHILYRSFPQGIDVVIFLQGTKLIYDIEVSLRELMLQYIPSGKINLYQGRVLLPASAWREDNWEVSPGNWCCNIPSGKINFVFGGRWSTASSQPGSQRATRSESTTYHQVSPVVVPLGNSWATQTSASCVARVCCLLPAYDVISRHRSYARNGQGDPHVRETFSEQFLHPESTNCTQNFITAGKNIPEL